MLPDTLGVLIPSEVFEYVSEIVQRYPHIHFDFHAHNDYDLGTANVLEAIKAGAKGLHLTINGMGERAGNAPLASAIAVLNDFMPSVKTSVAEKSLYSVSKLVETFSGFRIPANIGVNVSPIFTAIMAMALLGERFSGMTWAGTVISFAGIGVIAMADGHGLPLHQPERGH